MRLFVTGGSGFVGRALTRSLTTDYDVMAMARSDSGSRVVGSLGATPVRCSLENVGTEHLRGVEAVVHSAALVTEWSPLSDYQRVNVAGTARLLDAARAAGVRRFVHVSTDSVLFVGRDLVDVDESHPLPDRIPYGYGSTKAEAERLVRMANDPERGFETVVVRPVLVWGPGDESFLAEVIRAVEKRAFAWVSRGAVMVSTTHVDNLVHGIRLALERGVPGEVYFVTDGAPQQLRRFVTSYVATAGVDMPNLSVPAPLARILARIVEGLWAIVRPGSKPPLTRLGADMLACTITARIDKARGELGYEPQISIDQGLAQLRESVRPAQEESP